MEDISKAEAMVNFYQFTPAKIRQAIVLFHHVLWQCLVPVGR